MAYHKNGDNISEQLEITYNKQYMLSWEENCIWKRNIWSKVCGGIDDDDDDYDDDDDDYYYYVDAYRYDDINGDGSKLLTPEIMLKYIDRRGMAMK